MKFKNYILIVCLFAVLATKTFSVYTFLFTDVEIEQAQELDEEDSSDEEDTEKETSEKDVFYNEFSYQNLELKTRLSITKSKFYFYIHRYISPTTDTLFSPPELI